MPVIAEMSRWIRVVVGDRGRGGHSIRSMDRPGSWLTNRTNTMPRIDGEQAAHQLEKADHAEAEVTAARRKTHEQSSVDRLSPAGVLRRRQEIRTACA